MKFKDVPKSVLVENYANFKGRASRAEYWKWMGWSMIIGLVFGLSDGLIFHTQPGHYGPLSTILILALIVPNIALTVRRLHDVDRSGWWIFIVITIIGIFFPLLYWYCKKGDEAINSYGAPPVS